MSDWAVVATALNKRMRERGVNQLELSRISGVSVATLRKLQHGTDQPRNRSTLSSISRALGWADDHLWRVATGEPAVSGQDDVLAQVLKELAELRERVEALERRE